MEDLISVIVPVYNTEQYMDRCLNSLRAQHYDRLEILCVDDGSTDGSLARLREYAAADRRLRVISIPQSGVSAARNRALEEAGGSLVAFVDADDWVHPAYFSVLADILEKHGADVAVCANFATDQWMEPAALPDPVPSRLYSHDDFMGKRHVQTRAWERLYRRELLEGLRFDEGLTFAEDTLFNLRALCRKPDIRIAGTDLKLYYYYQRADSAVHALPKQKLLDMVRVSMRYAEEAAPCNRDVFALRLIRNTTYARWRLGTGNTDREVAETMRAVRPLLRYLPLALRLREGLMLRSPTLYQMV